jgi:hypothetical protein
MDPYLEDPTLWPGFHTCWIAALSAALNARLPGRYVAAIGERVSVVTSERDLDGDVGVQAPTDSVTPPRPANGVTTGATPPVVVVDEPLQVREAFIEIRAVRPRQRLVGVLEVLSPTNKYAGPGRELYLEKQRELLASPAHFIEMDLLRRGPHIVAAPAYRVLAHHGPYDYLISLHRAGLSRRFETWPFRLRQPLPVIVILLDEHEPDVVLDLGPVLTRAYDEGAYDRQIDYTHEPPDPLSAKDAAWADVLLRQRGPRPTPHGDAS